MNNRRRNSRGQFSNRMTNTDRLIVFVLWTFMIAVGLPLYYHDEAWVKYLDKTLFTAQASEPATEQIVSISMEPADDTNPPGESEATPAPTATPSPTPTAKTVTTPSQYDHLIDEIFGDKAGEAKQIMKCESGGRADNVGDTHLFVTRSNGDRVGDSIGLFQIRTGGKEFNRARANGMTPDEFRAEMKNPEKNIKYAKSMYDRQGWAPWWNCKQKLGL